MYSSWLPHSFQCKQTTLLHGIQFPSSKIPVLLSWKFISVFFRFSEDPASNEKLGKGKMRKPKLVSPGNCSERKVKPSVQFIFKRLSPLSPSLGKTKQTNNTSICLWYKAFNDMNFCFSLLLRKIDTCLWWQN